MSDRGCDEGGAVRFRKRPVEVEAVQLDGTPEGCRRVHDFLGWEHNDAGDCPGPIVIDTLEGDMWCQLGDWVVKGVQGEFYPVKPDIFAATYEPVESSASGGDEARCEHDIPLTMRCAWCEHAEARRSSPTDVTNVGCERCGGTRHVPHEYRGGEYGKRECPACGGRGHA